MHYLLKAACTVCIFVLLRHISFGQNVSTNPVETEARRHIREFIDTARVFDNHEHFEDPGFVRQTNFNDFTLLLLQYGYYDLLSAGMPASYFDRLFNKPLSPAEKFLLIEPYWKLASNTSFLKTAELAARKLYGVNGININSVDSLSARIARAYRGDWANHVLKELCRIDYIVQDSKKKIPGIDNVYYSRRFSNWLNVRTKFSIDSVAMAQENPIFTLEDYVTSLREAFAKAVKEGIVAVKINIAYNRSLAFNNTGVAEARKVFRTLITGNEDMSLTYEQAKPLQDYMMHRLLDLASASKLPVLFHTGLQAGTGNYLQNSDPLLLTNLFVEYPSVNFGLFHGSYPYGGQLAVLAKNFRNVFIDLNWLYWISPSYSRRYLEEWLETVPSGKIMAFGGDSQFADNTYAELLIAREIMTDVLSSKVEKGYLTEKEAIMAAGLMLHDNALRFYRLPGKKSY